MNNGMKMMDITGYIKEIQQALDSQEATEHTHRAALEKLIESARDNVEAINEPKRIMCGAPDFSIKLSKVTIGYIEAKDVGMSLDDAQRSPQLKRYLDALDNLLLTDYLEFRWYVNGQRRETTRIAHFNEQGKLAIDTQGSAKFTEIIASFLSQHPAEIKNSQELATRMAKLTHEIRSVILGAYEIDAPTELLGDLRDSFARTLLPDLNEPQRASEFADMFAQTLAYGLFAARCNHRGPKGSFQRLGAADEIPKTNPFLRKLFTAITGTQLNDEPYVGYVDDLVQLLANCDIGAILAEFGTRKRQEDPIVHFYETFLAAYDPKLRELRGVYYTPEPVVSYIVRSVDKILQTQFNLSEGLADSAQVRYTKSRNGKTSEETAPKVLILDPACGTGTFLYSVVNHIRESFARRNNAGMWSGYVRDHLLRRLFGFELLMAPYAVAHLKMAMQLAGQDLTPEQRETWAYNFTGDERLGIYLTNTLEEIEKIAQQEFRFIERDIAEEAASANRIKAELPVLVVLGNPPYSNFGQLNKSKFILNLLKDYKEGLKEKKLNLDDDFIKFIRWGQWRIDQTGSGVLALITNNTYIDGITHRRMRESLLETFTDIYVLNLHGSSKRQKKTPDGSIDENVFDIQQGVAISIFVKEPNKKAPGKVHYHEVWGKRQVKYDYLNSNDINTTKWRTVQNIDERNCLGQSFFFVPKKKNHKKYITEYCRFRDIREVFLKFNNGIKTDRDALFLDFDKNFLLNRMKIFFTDAALQRPFRDTYNITDSSGYPLLKRRQAESFDEGHISLCMYRPFDLRWLYYSPGLTSRPAYEVMKHLDRRENIALIGMRQYAYDVSSYCYTFATRQMAECRIFVSNRGIASVFPLYLYPDKEKNGDMFSNGRGRHVNLDAKFIAEFEKKLGMTFLEDGEGDLEQTFGPEDIFNYIYAIFHSPTYRERYAEFLKIDFPRVPLTADKQKFARLCGLGGRLVGLHLMESNELHRQMVNFPEPGDNRIEKGFPKYYGPEDVPPGENKPAGVGRVYINETQYFNNVPQQVWEFQVGGYQVCDKWLKDRREMALSFDDVDHYNSIVVALHDTLALMEEIDAVAGVGEDEF